MPDLTLNDLLDQVNETNKPGAKELVRKIESNWRIGVVPSLTDIDSLHKFLRVDGPCERVGDNGRCNGWLRKYAKDCGIVPDEHYTCQFGEKWAECPGYLGSLQG